MLSWSGTELDSPSSHENSIFLVNVNGFMYCWCGLCSNRC